MQEQLPEARKTLPKDSPELGGLLAGICMSLLQQKKWTEAEPLIRECLAIREKAQPDVWSTFNTQSLLGGAMLGQKKYVEAEPLLRKGFEGMKQREKTIPPAGSTRLPEALDRLIDLFTATNKPDEVKTWQAERTKYPATARRRGRSEARREPGKTARVPITTLDLAPPPLEHGGARWAVQNARRVAASIVTERPPLSLPRPLSRLVHRP